ncbi:hypothetical protein RFI_15580 [Reticulomyxa filosa]|uniref:Uncharacterized protein n=1 Tax=Reticulomyxa filosa TaxID=46433 RepID=X6N6Q7_RETFI|nr:hypothetical protein RFI_15580 [Reticulomyxa filosa]|eukprot:ETO21623.1 hypothetical protein RFI_15580 [Reticulomyxa filosa]
MLKHQNHYMFSMDINILFGVLIFRLQSNNENDNNIYNLFCSGSWDNTIRIWDIETTKQFDVFKEHKYMLMSVKYGSNELLNTILSGSADKNQVFAIAYSPFVIKNNIGNSNVICSGSFSNTICFWDIRSNKERLYVLEESNEIGYLNFLLLKKKVNIMNKNQKVIVVFIYIMAQMMVEFVHYMCLNKCDKRLSFCFDRKIRLQILFFIRSVAHQPKDYYKIFIYLILKYIFHYNQKNIR